MIRRAMHPPGARAADGPDVAPAPAPGVAVFRGIKDDLVRRIVSREWPPDSLLPNEVDLCSEYGVSRATIARAMRELVEDGLIERRRKAGTRVRSSPLRQARFEIPVVRHEILATGADYGYRLLSSEIGPAPDEVLERLGPNGGAAVRHVVCLHLADGQPYQVEDRWIDLGAVPGAESADFSATGPNEWLVQQVPYTAAEIALCAVEADEATAQHLGCAVGAALFRIERLTRWEGRSVTFVRLSFRPGQRLTTHY